MNCEDNKIVLKVYVEDGKYYIDYDMASAFGLVKSKPLANSASNKVQITDYLFGYLKNNKSIEIELVEVLYKPTIKVYIDGINRCITLYDAHVLGLLSDEEYASSNSLYYYISKDILGNLCEEYNVKLVLLNAHTKNLVKSI